MKKIMLIVSVLLVAGCENSYESLSYPVLPEDLKDCKFYEVHSRGGSTLKIVRCPQSDVSMRYIEGKRTITSMTVEKNNSTVIQMGEFDCVKREGK